MEDKFVCKCGAVREPNDILNTSGVIDFDFIMFTATFTCVKCVANSPAPPKQKF